MILTFVMGGDVVMVLIQGNSLLFTDSSTNFQKYAPIEGLKLDKTGILREFPDLKELPDSEIRTEAIKRFKQNLKNFSTEKEIKDYVTRELTALGYTLTYIQREGFRPEKVK